MLSIKKNNVDVLVSELSLLNGKEVLVLGNYERDLILRTKGNIKLQIQNKFIDLFKEGDNFNNTEENVFFIEEGDDIPAGESLIIDTTNNIIYYSDGTNLVSLNPSNTVSIDGLLSYNKDQSILNKSILYSNMGYAYPGFEDLRTSIDEYQLNQLIYFQNLQNHYILTDVTKHRFAEGWTPLYLNLIKGGNVKNNLGIHTSNFKASFTLYSNEVKNYGETDPKALFIGDPEQNSGLFIKHYEGGVYLDVVKSLGTLKFRTFVDGAYYDSITLIDKKMSIGDEISSVADLSVNLTSLFRKDIQLEKTIRSLNYSPYYRKREYYNQGFILNQGVLEVDEIYVKNPESQHKTLSVEEGLYGSKSYRVRIVELDTISLLYAKTEVTGRYLTPDLNDPVEFSERATKIQIYNDNTEAFEVVQLYFGIGDRDNAGVLITQTTYDYDGTDFEVPIGTHSFDGGSLSYVPTVGGTHRLVGQITSADIIFYTVQGLVVGDLLLFLDKDKDKEDNYGGFFRVLSITTVDDLTTVRCEIYGFDQLYLYKEMHLVKVGNITTDIDTLITQNNNQYHLRGVNTFNDLYQYWYNPNVYEFEDSWFTNLAVNPDKVISKTGDLLFLKDHLSFDPYIGVTENGSYFSNIFIESGYGLFDFFELGTQLTWDGTTLTMPRLDDIEDDITALEAAVAAIEASVADVEEEKGTFFPTVTTTDVFLNFREGLYVKTQSLVTVSLWINVNVNATGINTITIENLPFDFIYSNSRKIPALAYVNEEISPEAFIHPDPDNKITVKNVGGVDFTLAVHEIHVSVSYFI